MPFVPAYCLNGFTDHRLGEAIEVLAGMGYGGVAITLGPPHLDIPSAVSEAGDAAAVRQVRECLEQFGMSVVLETGGRYWLDPHRKHYPVLVSPEIAERVVRSTQLITAFETAHALGAEVVHCWSGAIETGTDPEQAWAWLIAEMQMLAGVAEDHGVTIGFEPEPGHLVATLADWERLTSGVSHPALQLTVDLGHIVCSEPQPWPAALQRVVDDVVHVQADDHVPGAHHHLPLGEGVLPLAAMLAVLEGAEYSGQVAVELARHSHDAPNQARLAIAALRAAAP